ncbi:MAG: DMT family transporter [Rhodocyclaceae bacterium]|nr:DMT family transporter [Rhodocyclaceae bacterium]
MTALTPHRAGMLLAIVAAFGFSFKAIFIKLAYPYGVDAITLLALRMAFALPIFLWVGFRASRSALPLSGRDWLVVLFLGSVGYYGASILDFLGLRYISAGLERLILFTYPTITLLLGLLMYQQRITRRQVGATLLCYAGIAAAFIHDLRISGDISAVWLGGALVFASSCCYALYLAGSAGMIARIGTARFTALALLVSSTMVFAHYFTTHPVQILLDQPLPVYGYALAMGLLSTAMPVFAQSAAVRRLGSGESALVSMVGPLLTIVFAAILLDEGFSLAQMVGVILVLAGVASLGRRAPDSTASAAVSAKQ